MLPDGKIFQVPKCDYPPIPKERGVDSKSSGTQDGWQVTTKGREGRERGSERGGKTQETKYEIRCIRPLMHPLGETGRVSLAHSTYLQVYLFYFLKYFISLLFICQIHKNGPRTMML